MSLQDEISFEPIKKDLRRYCTNTFLADLWAGISVALFSFPQAIAYSIVAGLPPSAGIVGTVLGATIASICGSSRHLVIGPGNAITLLVQMATADILYKYYQDVTGSAREMIALEIMSALTLLIGLFQLIAGIFKFGRIGQFVSHAVIIGYISGSAVALSADQLFNFFGVSAPEDSPSLYEKLSYFITHIDEIHVVTLFVGICSFLLLIAFKKMNERIPPYLGMLVAITLFVQLFGLSSMTDYSGRTLVEIGDTSLSEGIFGGLQLPLFEVRILNGLLPVAFAIALIGMLETNAIAKSIAVNTGQRLSSNQEVFALGVANTVLSLFGSLPCCGSSSRSLLNVESGAKTRFAAFFGGLLVLPLAYICGSVIEYVPLAALAAIILMIAARMVDRRLLKFCFRATHSDALVLVITFLSCIFFNLQIAFYIGVILSIMLYLRKAGIPRVVEYKYNEATQELRPITDDEREQWQSIRIIDVEGELFFGAVDLFQSALKSFATDEWHTKVIVLRLKHVRDMDATGALALKHLYDYLRKRNRHLVVASIPKHVWAVLEKSQLVEYIGKENLFLFDELAPHSSVEKALVRANAIVDESVTIEEVPEEGAILPVIEIGLSSAL